MLPEREGHVLGPIVCLACHQGRSLGQFRAGAGLGCLRLSWGNIRARGVAFGWKVAWVCLGARFVAQQCLLKRRGSSVGMGCSAPAMGGGLTAR